MTESKIISNDNFFQIDEKIIFDDSKEFCSEHNLPLFFFKSNSPDKVYYCHKCISNEFELMNKNSDEKSKINYFIKKEEMNNYYSTKMKELIKLKENEQNFKKLSEKYNEFGNSLIEFIVKETRKFINQLIIKNCLNEKNDLYQENIQIKSSVNFINSSEKLLNDAKSVECKALYELNLLQDKFIKGRYDLIEEIQKVCSNFFNSSNLEIKKERELTFEEQMDSLFSKFEIINQNSLSNNIRDTEVNSNDKKIENQSKESNKNSSNSSQVKNNNLLNDKINSMILFPIVKKNSDYNFQKPFEDENKVNDFAFLNTSNISINDNSDSSFSLDEKIKDCFTEDENKKEKEKENEKENNLIKGNKNTKSNSQNEEIKKKTKKENENELDKNNNFKQNKNINSKSNEDNQSNKNYQIVNKRFKVYNNFKNQNSTTINSNNNNETNSNSNVTNDYFKTECSDCRTPFLLRKGEAHWKRRCVKCQDFYKNRIFKYNMPNKKYYNSNEERKVKIVCIDCRKTFLCPIHLKGYRSQCLNCFKKSRFQNSEIFINDTSLSIGSNNNTNNENKIEKNEKIIENNDKNIEDDAESISFLNENSIDEKREMNNKSISNIKINKKNELLTFSNNSQRKKLKSENKKINLNSTF